MFSIRLFLVFLTLPLATYSQTIADENDNGIHWTNGLTWSQLVNKAKNENKYIFLDCYATWCVPCKKMDKEVYVNPDVGILVNKNFLAVKIQMDKTLLDADNVRKLYSDAHQIQTKYSITSYPTYLFFSSDGRPLHKGVGYKTADEFITLVNEVFDSSKQHYNILRNFQPGKWDTSKLKPMAYRFYSSDKELAGKIAMDYISRFTLDQLIQTDKLYFMMDFSDIQSVQDKARYILEYWKNGIGSSDYLSFVRAFKGSKEVQKLFVEYFGKLSDHQIGRLENAELSVVFQNVEKVRAIERSYINRLPEADFFKWENLMIIGTFTDDFKDRGFNIFFSYGNKIKGVIKQQDFGNRGYYYGLNYDEAVIDNIINNKLIIPAERLADSLKQDVNWKFVYSQIKRTTNDSCAERNILNAKVNWYKTKTRFENVQKRNLQWGRDYAYSLAEKLEKIGFNAKDGMESALVGNDIEYSIYRYCNDTLIIEKTLRWLQQIMDTNPGMAFSYVYAGLLYRIGRIEDAIKWQKLTMQICEAEEGQDVKTDSFYQAQSAILEKMVRRVKWTETIYWDFN